MTKEGSTEKIEEKVALVASWIKGIDKGVVSEVVSPQVLREVLEHFGADFDQGEEILVGLSEYKNKAKAESLRVVWGGRFEEFKKWTEEWADAYEALGNTLPRLGKKPKEGHEDTRARTSGMKQFFGELTAYATGHLPLSDFQTQTTTRVINGKLWHAGKGSQRAKIITPTSRGELIRISSIPPGFVLAAWEKITSWN